MTPVPPLTRRGLLGLAGGLGAAAALAACGGPEAPTARNATAAPIDATGVRTTIRTCVYAQNHASSPLFWQQFAPEGVTVEVQPVTTSADIQTAMENGDLDFGLIGTYSTLLAQEQGGFTSRIVGMVARGGLGLVGAPGVVESVEDLRGKRIAVPPPGQQVIVLNLLLAEAGLSLTDDMEAIPLGYADHLSALTNGDIDAFMGSEPPCSAAVASGVGVRVADAFSTVTGDFNTALWASPSMLRDEPETVAAAVAMQRAAAEHLSPGGENDPAVWKDLLVTQFGFDEAVYEEVLPNVGARWQFDAEREEQFRASGEFMVANGVLAREPDYEPLFAREYWDA